MSTVEDAIERICGSPVQAMRRFAGGDISGASDVTLMDGNHVVAKQGPVVAVEGRMLEAMRRTSAPVPEVIGLDDNVLVIEHRADEGPLTGVAWISLAEALKELHRAHGPDYGWDEDYALRHVAVENTRCDDWPTFWAERRLLCHLPELPRGLAKRVEGLAIRLKELLPRAPSPALVHGDLWGGNILVSGGAISALIDPCAYYGHCEVDVATMAVFDHPPQSFFDALQLEPGWPERQPIYRLWMWLVHVRLFGEGYRSAAERELDTLGF